MVWELKQEAYDGPAAAALISALQAEFVVRYGQRDAAPVDPTEFAAPKGAFLVGYEDSMPVGCGGLRVVEPGLAEFKRIYVMRSRRRTGAAKRVLASLEETARSMGCSRVRLLTGEEQPEAVALFESAAYRPIPAFGPYAEVPGSRFFGKAL